MAPFLVGEIKDIGHRDRPGPAELGDVLVMHNHAPAAIDFFAVEPAALRLADAIEKWRVMRAKRIWKKRIEESPFPDVIEFEVSIRRRAPGADHRLKQDRRRDQLSAAADIVPQFPAQAE